MSASVVIPWLSVTGNEAAIASVQTTTANNQSLVLNSTVSALPQGPYVYDKVIRNIIITRTNATLGNIIATITGIGASVDVDGNPIEAIGLTSEPVTTQSATAVPSTKIYSQIISITLANAVQGISVGFGASGITNYVFLDYNRKMFQTSVQLQFFNPNALSATVYQSLTNPQTTNTFGSLDDNYPLPAFAVSVDLTGTTTNQIGTLLSPVSLVWANMTGTTDESLYFTILQQGIR